MYNEFIASVTTKTKYQKVYFPYIKQKITGNIMSKRKIKGKLNPVTDK